MKHCSECINYETVNYFMFCKWLQKRITARKKAENCKGYENKDEKNTITETPNHRI